MAMQQKMKGGHKIVINQPSLSLHNNIVKYRVINSLLLDGTIPVNLSMINSRLSEEASSCL